MRLLVGIINEAKGSIGKTEAIEFLHVAHAENFDDIAIGDKTDTAVIIKPEVIVLHHHQIIASVDFLLTEKNRIADALIEKIGALVAASNHYHIFEGIGLILTI